MGFWDALGSMAGVKAMQSGSDVMIQRHTMLDPLQVPERWRSLANAEIKQRFVSASFDQAAVSNEMEAALFKLALYWRFAEETEAHDAIAVLGNALRKVRDAATPNQIGSGLSLEVMGMTGH